MGWWCCYCDHGMWNFHSPICFACTVHRRCHRCRMTTDSIDEQRYRIPLKPEWEAEETYNFNRFHAPGCDKEKCDGKCGQEDKKKLREEIRSRRDVVRERKKNTSESTTDSKEEPKTPPMAGKMEEPGDGAFVIGGKGKAKAKDEGGASKGRKKVKFAS